MKTIELYQRLVGKGFALTCGADDRLFVEPGSRLTSRDCDLIRRHKTTLLGIIRGEDRDEAVGTPANQAARGHWSDQTHFQFTLSGEEVVVTWYVSDMGTVFRKRFSMGCETELIREGRIPALAVISVSDGQTHYLVHPDDLSAFVLAHRNNRIVFHHAAFDYWVVLHHLTKARLTAAKAVWIDHLRQRRLHDTMLLDLLVRLAQGGDVSKKDFYRDLGRVAEELLDLRLDKESPYRERFAELIGADWLAADPGFFEYAVPDAIATARIYPVLHQAARQLMDSCGYDPQASTTFSIDPAAIRKFGVLTECVQVGAAIALAHISRTGMSTDQERLKQTAETHRQRLDRLIRTINVRYPGLFKVGKDGCIIRTAKTGAPSKSSKALDQYLLQAVAQIREESGQAIETPHTPKGQIAKSLEAWAPLLDQEPFLRLWADYEKTTKLCEFLNKLNVPVIHPRYSVLCRTGRTTCSAPNVQQIPRRDEFRETVIPSAGHLLLTVDYKFIELVTLAATCEQRFGFSRLGEIIRDGVDPHCYTAALLLGMGYDEFLRLKKRDLGQFKQWRQMAKPINFGVPGGMGAESLVDYARRNYHVELTVDAARDFRGRLVQDVYPELGRYLTDTSLKSLANNLGVDLDAVHAVFRNADGMAPWVAGSIRKIAEGRPIKRDGTPYSDAFVDRVWDNLNDLNHVSELAAPLSLRLGSKELANRLFFTSVATLTGRLRGGVRYTEERNTQFQGLAADGAKIALTGLVTAGFRVVGFVHDEALIELRDEGGFVSRAVVERAVSIMREGMEEVTYGIPVGCEYTVSTCWSKRAELIEDGDRICAWSPPESTQR